VRSRWCLLKRPQNRTTKQAGKLHLANLKIWLGGVKIGGTSFGFLEQLKNLKFFLVEEPSPYLCTNIVGSLKSSSVEQIIQLSD